MTDNETQAHENDRTLKAQQRRAKREEKRRNSLPRFLLLRAGCRSAYIFPLLTGVATCTTPYKDGSNSDFYRLLLVLTVGLTCIAGIHSKKRAAQAKEDIKSIQYEMSEYIKDPEYTLDLSRVRNFPRLTSILVRHITKNNPGIFDKFIKTPQSVPDNEAMQDIIRGYLNKHHDAAPKILEALEQIKVKSRKVRYDEPETYEDSEEVLPVSYELRKRLERRARRAKMAEVCH